MLWPEAIDAMPKAGAGYDYERLGPAADEDGLEVEAAGKVEFAGRECSSVFDSGQEPDRDAQSEDGRDQVWLQASCGCPASLCAKPTKKQGPAVSEAAVSAGDHGITCSINSCSCSCSSIGFVGVTCQLCVIAFLVVYSVCAWRADAGARVVDDDSDTAPSLIPIRPWWETAPNSSNESDSQEEGADGVDGVPGSSNLSEENHSLEFNLQPSHLPPMRGPPAPVIWHKPPHVPPGQPWPAQQPWMQQNQMQQNQIQQNQMQQDAWGGGDFAQQARVEMSMPTEIPPQRLQRLFQKRRYTNATAAHVIENMVNNVTFNVSLPAMAPKPPSPLTLLPPEDPYVNPVAARLNARFRRNPWEVTWPSDGTLADAGLLMKVTHGSGGGALPPKLPWDQPKAHGMDGVCSSMVYAAQHPANGAIPLFIGGAMGIILRPGAAKIVCGKPNDSLGHCRYDHCPRKPGDWGLSNCMWKGNETGYFMDKIKHQMGYNEIILNISHWPDDIVEASWGDPLLPKPHLKFTATNWTHPFQ